MKDERPEKLRILIIEERSHEPELAEGHQGMKEIAVDAWSDQRGAVTGHPIDHHALDIVLLDSFHDLCEMDIDIQFLRAIEQDMDNAGVDLLLQIQAKGLGIADDLRRVLIQRDQQSSLLSA